MISLVIPVYKNSDNIAPLLDALQVLARELAGDLEVVFVVDGSPDDSYLRLQQGLATAGLRAQLLLLSRNFGAFAAIRAGLAAGRGERFAVMAADLQEPPSLVLEFNRVLRGGSADVAIGQRVGRSDPLLSRMMSSVFWSLYRRFIITAVPPGGVDVFGCTREVRDQVLALRETNSSLVGLLFWVGFRRAFVPYERQARTVGVSAWTFGKKLTYLLDSTFSFSDLPIRLLTRIGAFGLLISVAVGGAALGAKLLGAIPVPGYAALAVTITFFGALNCFGLGVIGGYVWRAFENTKDRPNYIVARVGQYPPGDNVD